MLVRIKELWSHLSWSELSGCVGDLGTFIPIFIALAQSQKIQPHPALFWAGISNVVTGIAWDVPMPVQPMKSIATTALLDQLTAEQVKAAGIWMGLLLLVLSPFIEYVNRVVPPSVVYGLQIGVGLSLSMKGLSLLDGMQWLGPEIDCLALALFSALAAFHFLKQPSSYRVQPGNTPQAEGCRRCMQGRPVPVGLYLFGLAALLSSWRFEPSSWKIHAVASLNPKIYASDWLPALLRGALPQLPLTTLNSVISVCTLANTLYNERPRNHRGEVIAKTHVCVSVALLNIILCPLGAIPVCHGAGGLAGQHRFGARHGSAVVVLGLAKIAMSVGMGSWLLDWISAIPSSILSVLLFLAGLELAVTGLESVSSLSRVDQTTTLVTTACSLGWHATHYGAISGWLIHCLLRDNGEVGNYNRIQQSERCNSIADTETEESNALNPIHNPNGLCQDEAGPSGETELTAFSSSTSL